MKQGGAVWCCPRSNPNQGLSLGMAGMLRCSCRGSRLDEDEVGGRAAGTDAAVDDQGIYETSLLKRAPSKLAVAGQEVPHCI